MKNDQWAVYTWYCVNCAAKVTGYPNPEGRIKCTCGRCGSVMVRTIRSRRHDSIEVYAPAGYEHYDDSDYIPEDEETEVI